MTGAELQVFPRYMCLSCFRNRFTQPKQSHKQGKKGRNKCKGRLIRIFKSFDVEKYLIEHVIL